MEKKTYPGSPPPTSPPPTSPPPTSPPPTSPPPTSPPPTSPPTDQDQIAKILLDILKSISSQTTTRTLSQKALDAIARYGAIAADLKTSPFKTNP